MADLLLVARGLSVSYASRPSGLARRPARTAVLQDIDLVIHRGEAIGIVGESGSGKTTLGRTLLGLIRPDSGSVSFDGAVISALDEASMRPLRRRMQMIFQDPMSSLNPRHRIGTILTGPMLLHGLAPGRREAAAAAAAVLASFGLPESVLDRYPHQLSGGQRQRIGIARAVLLHPDFVLADEIVSGLDVSTQAQVLRLIGRLRRDMGLALAFISHDLAVVRAVCERVYVMQSGRIVETGPCSSVFADPKAACTRLLIDAIPSPVPDPGWLDRGPDHRPQGSGKSAMAIEDSAAGFVPP